MRNLLLLPSLMAVWFLTTIVLTTASPAPRRRILIDNDPEVVEEDDPIKEGPCLNEDGEIVIPSQLPVINDENPDFDGVGRSGGERRRRRMLRLRRLEDGYGNLMDCEPTLANDNETTADLSIAPNSSNQPPPSPLPTVQLADSPSPAPLNSMYPPLFLDENASTVLACVISTALPIPLLRAEAEENYVMDNELNNNDDASSSDDLNHSLRRASKKLLDQVRKFFERKIMELTDYDILEGPSFLRRRHLLQGSTGGGGGGDVKQWNRSIPSENILLRSIMLTNYTFKEDQPHGPDITWVMFRVVFRTLNDDPSLVNSTLFNLTASTIESGELLTYLRKSYRYVAAVTLPGMEAEAIISDDSSSDDPGSTFSQDFEPHDWDPSRWIGLSLFLGTILLMFGLSRTASSRRKLVKEQQDWGIGLSTEDDINKLLTYGWEYDGAEVHAFDKSKLIYRDDDSMLIGNAVNAIAENIAPTEPGTTSETRGSATNGSRLGMMSSASRSGSRSGNSSIVTPGGGAGPAQEEEEEEEDGMKPQVPPRH